MAYKPVGADENGNFPPRVKAALNASYLTVLVHNGTAYPTRPAGAPAGMVRYVGPTEPTSGMLTGDEYVSTTSGGGTDTTAPSAVTGLTAGTATTTTVPLSWTAATDAVGVAGYEYSTNGSSYTSTGSTGTSYTVTGLTQGTAYTLYVRAFDAAGNRGTAASVAKTTAASSDVTAPTVPTNLAGTAGATTMDLSWTASTDAVGVTGYRVSKDNGATWITSAVTGTTYQVTGLTASTSYTFAVAARDAAGNWSTNATLTKSTSAGGGGIPSGAYDDAALALSPTWYLPLDEPAGSTAVTSQGSSSKTWVVNGPPTFGVAGIGDGATAAQPVGTVFPFTTSGTFNNITAMSLAMLVKVGSLNSGLYENDVSLYISAGKVVFKQGANTWTGATTLTVGQRVHIAAVMDGTNVIIYLNGVADFTTAYTGGVPANGATSRVGIGGGMYAASTIFAGVVTKAGTGWSQAQVQTLVTAAGL